MPRILPRLLAKIKSSPQQSSWNLSEPLTPRGKKRKSLYRPIPPRPSFLASDYQKSILLDSPQTNPITRSRVYIRHKRLPPHPQLSRRVGHRGKTEYDGPRPMTEQERQLWSSPYLRMLASPIRLCIATDRHLPSDFLIRLAAMRIPTPDGRKGGVEPFAVLPDGLQHSQFTVRKSGRAVHILCSRTIMGSLTQALQRRRGFQGTMTYPLIADHVGHLLRLRVLQELELVADALDASLRSKGHPKHHKPRSRLIRRLTREEWTTFRATSIIPHENGLAVLILPPLQKDPNTGKRPEPSMSAAPLQNTPTMHAPTSLPICTLYPVGTPRWDADVGDNILPEARIPSYNGVSMFPATAQRAALHALLLRLLGLERLFGHDPSVGSTSLEDEGGKESRRKPSSHAFLLCSDSDSVLRGDMAAVAIALWRVRMYEDSSRVDTKERDRTGGWERTKR